MTDYRQYPHSGGVGSDCKTVERLREELDSKEQPSLFSQRHLISDSQASDAVGKQIESQAKKARPTRSRKKPITRERIERSLRFVEKKGNLNINNLSGPEYIDLIRTYYDSPDMERVNGTRIADMKPNQLYMVARWIYFDSHDIAARVKTGEDLEGKVA